MVTQAKISVKNLNISFGSDLPVLKDVSLDVLPREILSVIGPANSGKTTFLKSLNRLLDFFPNAVIRGEIRMDGKDIYRDFDPVVLRQKVGIIFALPIPLPSTVFENVVYGPRRQGMREAKKLSTIAERALRDAYLWEEVKDRLDESAMQLSGGQQQRLCIARTLAVDPEVMLFDEPCSALDPISTAKIEEALSKLKERYTMILVTNNTKQAARIGDRTAFFLMGELIELDATSRIFTSPKDRRTDDYISGRFG